MSEHTGQLPDKVLYSKNPGFLEGAVDSANSEHIVNPLQSAEDSVLLTDPVGFNVAKAVLFASQYGVAKNSKQRGAVIRQVVEHPEAAQIVHALDALADPKEGIARLDVDYGILAEDVRPRHDARQARLTETALTKQIDKMAADLEADREMQYWGVASLGKEAIHFVAQTKAEQAQLVRQKIRRMLGQENGEQASINGLVLAFIDPLVPEEGPNFDTEKVVAESIEQYVHAIFSVMNSEGVAISPQKMPNDRREEVIGDCVEAYSTAANPESLFGPDETGSQAERAKRAKKVITKAFYATAESKIPEHDATAFIYDILLEGVQDKDADEATSKFMLQIAEKMLSRPDLIAYIGGALTSAEEEKENGKSKPEYVNVMLEILDAMHARGSKIYDRLAERFIPVVMHKVAEMRTGRKTLKIIDIEALAMDNLRKAEPAQKEAAIHLLRLVSKAIYGTEADQETLDKLFATQEFTSFREVIQSIRARNHIAYPIVETYNPGPLRMATAERTHERYYRPIRSGTQLDMLFPGRRFYAQFPLIKELVDPETGYQLSDYVKRKFQVYKSDVELRSPGYMETLSWYCPELYDREQLAELREETYKLRVEAFQGTHFVSPRGDRIVIDDNRLQAAGFEAISFFKDPDNKSVTQVRLEALGHEFWCAIDPHKIILSELDRPDKRLLLCTGQGAFLEHLIISYFHSVRTNHEVVTSEPTWKDAQGGIVEFRRGHLREQGKNIGEEQVRLARVEQNFDLRADYNERLREGLPTRTYVREITNPFAVEANPMKVAAPRALDHIKRIRRQNVDA